MSGEYAQKATSFKSALICENETQKLCLCASLMALYGETLK